MFPEFKKIPRLRREVTITEKLDGTNGLVAVYELSDFLSPGFANNFQWFTRIGALVIAAGSKSRWLNPSSAGDNYGFCKWVEANAEELAKLGPGLHYGEWWGQGIQRGYGLTEKRFSLFNTYRWKDNPDLPKCCHVVPVLYKGVFHTEVVNQLVEDLKQIGSQAAPGYKDAEGVIVYHDASKQYYKQTCEDDDQPKEQVKLAKTHGPRNSAGRRKEQVAIAFPDRRQK